MPDIVEATIRDVGTIHVTCERCGHEYEYDQIFLGKTEVRRIDPRPDSIKALKVMAEQIRSGFGKGDYRRLEWHRCPECGFTQSWMAKRTRKSLTMRIFFPIILVALLAGSIMAMFQSDAMIGGQILRTAFYVVGGALVAGSLFWLFYRPPRHGVERIIPPTLTFSSESPEALNEMIVGNLPDDRPGER